MKTELMLDKFSALPANMQQEVVDFVEFLFSKVNNQDLSSEMDLDRAISENLGEFLNQRLSFEANREKAHTWRDLKKTILADL